jgi:hypothetical protein
MILRTVKPSVLYTGVIVYYTIFDFKTVVRIQNSEARMSTAIKASGYNRQAIASA